ncbi:MAG: hypothetical protein O7B99_09480 [Planctomycetota bacterium]|nr:hypothetical protein [Planctomycetota bacterium]
MRLPELVLAGLLAAAIAPYASSQVPVQRLTSPPQRVVLNLASGVVSKPVPGIQGAQATSFANMTTAGLFATPLVLEEWVDWGVKAGGLTGIVCMVEFGYGTTELDTTMGGAGAALDLALYEGTLGACGAGDVASELTRFSLTGLPGSLDGGAAGYIVQMNLEPAISLPDGPLGWGYVGVDGKTGPLLISVGADGTGTVDLSDLYVPAPAPSGACLGSFNFLVPNTASFYLRLVEEDGTATGSQVQRFGSGVNVGVLSLPGSTPAIGQIWDPIITMPAVTNPVFEFIGVSTMADPGTIVPGLGEFLIDTSGPNPVFFGQGPFGYGQPFLLSIPFDCSVVGLAVSIQAGQGNALGELGLTNAIDAVVGT